MNLFISAKLDKLHLSEEYYKTKWLPTQLRQDTTWTVHLNLKLVEVFFPPQQVIQENKLPFQESDAGSKGNIFTERSAKISKLHETKQKHR